MLETLSGHLELSPDNLAIAAAVIFIAAIVRGFTGFALSALIMASLAVIIPPIHLIPICFLLEATASLVMFRGGLKNADFGIVKGLVIGSVVGIPIGLAATTTLPVDTSKLIALCLILALAAAQLFRIRPAFLATLPGLYASGAAAGIATGLASVGGMIVALYVLSREVPAKNMRASLVIFLFVGIITSGIYLYLYDMLNMLAIKRGALFAPLVIAGVFAGSMLFRPSMERFYRRICLVVLMVLAAAGILRVIL